MDIAGIRRLVETHMPYAVESGNINSMIAIAVAESDGNPDAMNPDSTATGLLQIMYSVWARDPDARKLITDRNSLKDPVTNVKVGDIVLRKQGLRAWSTYGGTRYNEIMTKLGGDMPESQTQNAGLMPDLGAVGDSITSAFSTLMWTITGISLLIVGLVILARNQMVNIVPQGKALTALKAVKGAAK